MAVTDEDVDAATDRVVARYKAMAESSRFTTVVIGLLPIIYGLLTWSFGDALWASSPIYRTALAMPYAPQSWGLVFVALGTLTIIFTERERSRASMITCLTTAFVLSGFMTSFMIVAIEDRTSGALPPAVIYALFAGLYLDRARLAWKIRR